VSINAANPSSSTVLNPAPLEASWSQQRIAVATMVFFGAFLAFGMEPIVGRMVTPYFGGAVYVWTISLTMFQALLLAGYLYAHFLAPRIGAWHLLVLLLPLLQWPLNFSAAIAPQAPIATLIVDLLVQISLPFAVLSTTAVVAQIWWHRARVETLEAGASPPYFLYAISNLGALLALFIYPFLIEPFFGVSVQRWAWSVGYLLYAAATAWVCYLLRPQVRKVTQHARARPAIATQRVLRWLLLSAAPSALLLAVTNVIATEVGSFPMVWVLPLALYLASFILAFRDAGESLFRRLDFWLLEIAVLALLAAHLKVFGWWLPPVILTSFFCLCLIANRQLYRLRPDPARLTDFYLAIAVGGVLGGALVSLVAPLVFSELMEYPVAVLAVVAAGLQLGRLNWWRKTTFEKGAMRGAVLMFGLSLTGLGYWSLSGIYAVRNLYGVSRVFDVIPRDGQPAYRILAHGATIHGMQYLDPAKRTEPIGYYYMGGALQQAASLRRTPARVAMLGLGAGGALPWFQAGEQVSIFEIDPDMEALARRWFGYLIDSPARIDVHIGDARLKLYEEQRRAAPLYDMIIIDAFSGDAVPTHLLTLDALDVYLSRLSDDGIIVFHVSNRFYDLRPVIKAAARARGLAAVVTKGTEASKDRLNINPWVAVVSRSSARLTPLPLGDRWMAVSGTDGLPTFRVWTDDYINILAPLSNRSRHD